MSESSSSASLATLVDYSNTAPTEYPRAVSHPFSDVGNFTPCSDTIEVCAPRRIFKDSAKSLVQFNTADYCNMADYHHLAFELLGFVANAILPAVTVGEDHPVLVLFGVVPKQVSSSDGDANDEDEDGVAPIPIVECDQRDIVALRLRVVVQSARYSIGAIVDGLLEDNEYAPRKQLQLGRISRRSSQEFAYKKMTRHTYINMCVAYSGDQSLLNDVNVRLPLWDIHNPINPVRVFTLKRSAEIAEACGGMSEYCDVSEYAAPTNDDPEEFTIKDHARSAAQEAREAEEMESGMAAADAADDPSGGEDVDQDLRDLGMPVRQAPGGKKKKKGKLASRIIKIVRQPMLHAFPRLGYNTYLIQRDHIHPFHQSKYFFPYLRKLVVGLCEEEKLYRALSGIAPGVVNNLYAACVNVDAVVAEPNDLDHLRKRMQERYAGITIDRRNLTKYTAERKRLQLIGLKEWEKVYNVDGDIADSIKTIIKWDKAHLTKNKNFCMPLPLVTRNLSRIANFFVSLNMSLETIWGVSYLNSEVISGWVGDMRVYMVVPFQVHTLLCGDHSAGKSFILETQMSMLIPGTYTESAYESDKAKAVEGKMYDMQPEFFPEVPPHMIGVGEGPVKNGSGGGTSASQGNNANTTAEALLKMRLTTGRMPFTVKQVTDDGKHVAVKVVGHCNVKFNGAVNLLPDVIPAAVRSRFYISVIQKGTEREDKSTPVEKNNRAMNLAVIEAKAVFVYRMQRTQSLCSKIMTLISGGVLVAPNMEVALRIMIETLERAKASGMEGTDQVRNVERVTFMMQVVCILDGIDTIFDSEVSPLKDKAYASEDLLLVEPYLVGCAEHISIALSLLEKQFESPVVSNVLRHLKKKFKAVRPPPLGPAQLVLVGGQLASSLAMPALLPVAAAAAAAVPNPMVYNAFPKAASSAASSCSSISSQLYSIQNYIQPTYIVDYNGKIAYMSREIIDGMNPQPSEPSLRSALHSIFKMTVLAGDVTNPTLRIQMLDFGHNSRGLAYSALEKEESTDRLADAFISVMSYPGAPKQTFAYIKSNPKHPYIIKTFTNNPSHSNKQLVMHDPNHFDEVMIRVTQAFSEGITDGIQQTIDWSRVFSPHADKVLVGSADQYAILHHCSSLSMSAAAMNVGPSVFPRGVHQGCMNEYDSAYRAKLPLYPSCFMRILNGASVKARSTARVPTSDIVSGIYAVMAADARRQLKRKARPHDDDDADHGEGDEDDYDNDDGDDGGDGGDGDDDGDDDDGVLRGMVEYPLMPIEPLDTDEFCCDADVAKIMAADASIAIGPASMIECGDDVDVDVDVDDDDDGVDVEMIDDEGEAAAASLSQ